MSYVLETADGTVINASQITTAKSAVDSAAYDKASFGYYLGARKIRETEDNPELQAELQRVFDETYPNGRPKIGDFQKTQVRLSDGQILWVEKNLVWVKQLMRG